MTLICPPAPSTPNAKTQAMSTAPQPLDLGTFSLSLAVKDLAASRRFYEALGFAFYAGDPAHNYLILRNGSTTVGLFQGMFEKNLLTFNPGWDADCNKLASFTDVRELQRRLRERGITPTVPADEAGSGPAHFVVEDPDGNPVLIDQHV
jgi:catechol 2,3-dioxygenase-like lactoylglutathione lyase family enzyme